MNLRQDRSIFACAANGSTVRRGALGAALAAVVVLALAPVASAAFAPLLTAKIDAVSLVVRYSQPASNDGAAVIELYVPPTYAADLPAKAGTVVAAATANAIAADISGSTVTLDGALVVASAATPLDPGGAGATVGEAAQACAGTAPTVALWLLTMRGFGQTLELAVAVRRVETGPLAGGLALVMCPPPATVPSGTAGRSPLGLKIVYLALRLRDVFTAPAGTHVWHLKATPYTPGTALANPAAAVEDETQHGLPGRLTLAAKRASNPRRAAVSGRLTLAGKGVAGRTVRILLGAKTVGRAKTDASGDYTATVAVPRKRVVLRAKAVVPAEYLPSCVHAVFAPIPCTTSIVTGFTASSGGARLGA